MTTIEQHSQYATLINVFVVEPDRAADLAALLVEATDNVMRHRPGFRSANIHVSTDRTRVLNYAQWDSPEAYAAMLADPGGAGAHGGSRVAGVELRPAPVHRRIGARTLVPGGLLRAARLSWQHP